jgi:PleD family two-component response regulator
MSKLLIVSASATKNGDTIFLTVSIGVATRPYNSLEEMMDASDALLYKAKTNGKNQTVTD